MPVVLSDVLSIDLVNNVHRYMLYMKLSRLNKEYKKTYDFDDNVGCLTLHSYPMFINWRNLKTFYTVANYDMHGNWIENVFNGIVSEGLPLNYAWSNYRYDRNKHFTVSGFI